MFGRREISEARERAARLEKELAETKKRLKKRKERIERLESVRPPFPPERLVWIFGTSRSGTTWLSRMMGEPEAHEVWREPRVGHLFGEVLALEEHQQKAPKFVLSERHKDAWLPSVRSLVLEGARARFPEAASGYLIVKEPNGAVGAPLLMEALPESRMILLVRDPRDVVASLTDAHDEDGWMRSRKQLRGLLPKDHEEDPIERARRTSENWLLQMTYGKEAYHTHQGPKVMVTYEELRADTSGTMKHIYTALGIPVDDGELTRMVEKHSWENVPEEEKGEGKFYRKATPGGWKVDLTPEQTQIVEEITKPLLHAFYPDP